MQKDDVKKTGLPTETSAVINTCGKNIFTPILFPALAPELYKSRVDTNLILRDAILKLAKKPSTFVTMSGAGIYKPDPSIVHDESSTEFSGDFWQDLVSKWEAACELPDGCPTKTLKIRAGAVLSRQGGMVQMMYPQFQWCLGGRIGSGEQYMPFIHIRDLVRLIVFCCEIDTNQEFTRGLARGMLRPHKFHVPEWLIRRTLSKERQAILLGSTKVYPRKALDNGFEFFYQDIYAALNGLISIKYYAIFVFFSSGLARSP